MGYAMQFDGTINLVHLSTVLLVIGGGWVALRSAVASLSANFAAIGKRVSELKTDLTAHLANMSARVDSLEKDIRELNKVVIATAVTEERIGALRSELTTFMNTQINSHTEWRAWVCTQFERMQEEIRGSGLISGKQVRSR
jgi:ABC-type transporter Mla subunit MlaD